MSKKIFITGATGFLGSSLVKKFLTMGYDIHALIRKNSDKSRLINLPNINYIENREDYIKNFFKKNKIDILIHTACNYGRGDENHKEVLNTNINLGVQLIDLCDKFNVPLFINTHSTLPRDLNIYSSKLLQVYCLFRSLKVYQDFFLKYNLLNFQFQDQFQ